MKILHTSDWHLGQKFLHQDRQQEHQQALDWLGQTIVDENIDLLVVAGDIFDIGNPPNYARRMYYQFLTSLLGTCCRHIVITGGNHDSPSMLDAPKELLQSLNVHIVGAATDQIADEVIELKNEAGLIECVVAAVPFLRDRDLRTSVSGESSKERIDRIKEGIYKHYQEVARVVQKHADANIPIIATGHLFAKGATASDKQDNIYIGNMDNIEAEQFPNEFHYIALGHIHKAQVVGRLNHVRYCGSIIPLSFSEVEDKKVVKIIQFEGTQMSEGVKKIPLPIFRILRTLKGSYEDIQKKLEQENKKIDPNGLKAWIEVIIDTDQMIPNLAQQLKAFVKDMHLDLLKIRTNRKHFALEAQTEVINLDDLDPIDVFKKKCESYGSPPEEMEELVASFNELQNWMQAQEDENS